MVLLAQRLEEERKVGLPPRKPFPVLRGEASPPFVREVAIFVSADMMLTESSECAGDLMLNDDPVRLSRAYGLATFCRVVSSGITGTLTSVSYSEGTFRGSYDFTDDDGRGGMQMRPKVEIHIIAMLADYDKPLTETGNVVGFIIRALSMDPEYSFSTALARVIHQNALIKSGRLPNNTLCAMLKQLNKDCGTFVNSRLSHRDLFSVIGNYQHCAEVFCEWANRIRRDLANTIANNDIDAAERVIRERVKRKERARQRKEKERKRKLDRKADGDAGDADEAEEDDDDDEDGGEEELSPEKEQRIRERALRSVAGDTKLDINKLMARLGFELPSKDTCRLSHDSLLELTMQADSAMHHARDVAGDTDTPKAVIEGLQYQVSTFAQWVNCAMIPFIGTQQEVATIQAAHTRARMLDADVRIAIDLDETPLSMEKTFTLAAALARAHAAGACESRCDVESYYAFPKQPSPLNQQASEDALAEMEWGIYPKEYDPARKFDCTTFGPLGVLPVWVRAGVDAPWAAQIPDVNTTWRLTMADLAWSRFLTLRFPWAEDDTPARIEAAYKHAIEMTATNSRLVSRVISDIIRLRAEDAQDGVMADDCASTHGLKSGHDDADEDAEPDMDGADVDDELIDAARELSTAGQQMALGSRVVTSEKRQRFTIDAERTEEELRKENGGVLPEMPSAGMMNTYTHYVSNFTIARREGTGLDHKMRQLALLDHDAYMELMPNYRRMCMRRFARIYLSGAYNNGSVMRAIRAYDQKMWTEGAYHAVANIEADLSRFGNRMAGDLISLQASEDLNTGHVALWRMLVGMRIVAFDNNASKLHQLMLSKTSLGKSHLFGVLRKLSLPESIIEAIHRSAQSGLDKLASDDEIWFGDEAPDTVTRSGRSDDPQSALAANVLRTTASEGAVSASRSVMGMISHQFKADSHITYVYNTNFLLVPKGFERSTIMRFSVMRFLYGAVNDTMVYRMHMPKSGTVSVSGADMEHVWKTTQCLGGIMAKAMMTYGLPDPDTSIVPLMLEHVLCKVDGWMPLWAESMRASQRMASMCRAFAMFSAIDAVFNSPLSIMSPERIEGRRVPFDPMQMLACAPHMFTTTEMFIAALLLTIEEAVPTDAHAYMYALASRGGWRNSCMERLFKHGGRDHVFTLNRTVHTDHAARSTACGFVTRTGVEVTPAMVRAWKNARVYAQMRDNNEPEWIRLAAEVIRASTEVHDGMVVDVNHEGNIITDKMRLDSVERRDLLAWYDDMTQEQRTAIADASTRPADMYRWRISGWQPEHWDRPSIADMPMFWREAMHRYSRVDEYNAAGGNEAGVTFHRTASGDYDPNFIDIDASVSELAPVLAQLLDASVSRQNVDYAMMHYLSDRSVTAITLPRLCYQSTNSPSKMRWMVDASGKIVTHCTNFVRINREDNVISINTVWLFAGCPHNHIMDILCSFEDDHVPDAGRTIVLPMPFPDAPWIMQPFVMRRRPGHIITVANPHCSNATVARTGARTIAARGATAALAPMLAHDAEIRLTASSLVEGGAYRAAREVTTATAHSIDREAMDETSTTRVVVPAVYTRLAAERRRTYSEFASGDALSAEPDEEVAMNDPRVLALLASFKKTESINFFSPSKKTVSFVDRPAEDELYEAFLRRAGISRAEGAMCRPSLRDRLSSKDHIMVARLIERAAQRAGRDVVAHYSELLRVMSAAPGSGALGDMVDTDDPPAGAEPMDIHVSDVLNNYRQSRQTAIALGNHFATMDTSIPYPDKHIAKVPAWVARQEELDAERREELAKAADPSCPLVHQLRDPPAAYTSIVEVSLPPPSGPNPNRMETDPSAQSLLRSNAPFVPVNVQQQNDFGL